MSSSRHNGQGDEENADEATTPSRDNFKQKPASKVVRVLTVLAYLLSVSLAAILLSIYYLCVWKSPVLQPLNTTETISARRDDLNWLPQTDGSLISIGRSNTSINEIVIDPTTTETTSDLTESSSVQAFEVNSTLIPSILPDDHQFYTNRTLEYIGTLNQTESVT